MNQILTVVVKHPWYVAAWLAITAPVVAYFLNTLKTVLSSVAEWLLRLVFVCKSVESKGENCVSNYLRKHSRVLAANSKTFSIERSYIPSEKKQAAVVFQNENISSWKIYLLNGVPILFTPSRHVKPIVEDGFEVAVPEVKCGFWYLRGSVDWVGLLCKAASFYDANESSASGPKQYRIVRHFGSNNSRGAATAIPNHQDNSTPYYKDGFFSSDMNSSIPLNFKPADFISLEESTEIEKLSVGPDMQVVLDNVRFWHSHREWYRERGLPWRRGVLLHGAPGGGKTSIVRAIAEELDLPIHVFDLAGMDNRQFQEAWESGQSDGARIVLFEDFDSVFDGRDSNNPDLSFDTILNVIDGIEREDGLLLFINTNHLERIDPALGVPDAEGKSTRPGRIDLIVHMEGLTHAGRVKIANRILKDDLASEKIALDGIKDSPAQFIERCMNQAISELWGSFSCTTE